MSLSALPDHPQADVDFIVASEVMQKFMAMVERVARHMGTVLIFGETGTGKERIAHAIHEHSLRSEQPFVDINCAALPEHLVESELFGYEKGAFSGADTAKAGLFELAHKGTIFLDEIGELELRVQVKLLRILDKAPYYRLGGHRKITTDVRVVAATNRDLREEVRAGRFRKDLYHRLSQFELSVPPLRDRPEDIVAIARHLIARDAAGVLFSAEALRVLETYAWPGNVRELQNVVNKVVFAAEGDVIGGQEIAHELSVGDPDADELTSFSTVGSRQETPKAQAIQKALKETGGHRGQAAVQLGISRRTLSRKLRDYGLSAARSAVPLAASTVNDEARQRFRAEIRVRVSLMTADGDELACTTNNLGTSGMGLEGLGVLLAYRSRLRVRFQFPESDKPVETMATLAWADKHGCAGVVFTDTPAAVSQEISEWLHRKMLEENWGDAAISATSLDKYPTPGTIPN
jgi:transcriptional regulator with AAA-type ATPase domain